MRKIKQSAALLLTVVLLIGLLAVPAAAADWPQFLGDPAAQGISAGDGARTGAELALRWAKIGKGDVAAMSWQDVPGTPIVVGDYVYYYCSQYLRKVELATGKELMSVQVYGVPTNQFFINIAYGDGKIFVPCQTDNLDDGLDLKGCFMRVYDAETLEQLYVTEAIGNGQPQSPVMYHDGYFVTGIRMRSDAYVGFTSEDEDPTRSDEIKKIIWRVDTGSKYSLSFNGAAFVGDYCYFGCQNILYTVNNKTGEYETLDIGAGHRISSTITYSAETKRLYVASNHPDFHAAVFSYELGSDGAPLAHTVRKWVSTVENGGTQSSPVVYKGRLYIGGGGHTMGSYEPFHVLDAVTMQEIYSVPVLSKGSAGISTAYAAEENNWQVYIYMVPFTPNAAGNSEIWIISDSQGQTEAKYEIVDNIGVSEYCSQSMIVAHDGSLVWYNDAARLYCYENVSGVFTDTQEHWGRKYISYLARRGIINGMGDGTFAPDATVTRAHFVQMLANMSGEDLNGYRTEIYNDVHDEWYAPAIAWAAHHGIADTDTDTFDPISPIVREDMALMLYRYMTKVAKADLPYVKDPVDFTDSADISPRAVDAVISTQRSGVINGIPDGSGFRFAPKEQATRAQASTMLTNFYNALNEQD